MRRQAVGVQGLGSAGAIVRRNLPAHFPRGFSAVNSSDLDGLNMRWDVNDANFKAAKSHTT